MVCNIDSGYEQVYAPAQFSCYCFLPVGMFICLLCALTVCVASFSSSSSKLTFVALLVFALTSCVAHLKPFIDQVICNILISFLYKYRYIFP